MVGSCGAKRAAVLRKPSEPQAPTTHVPSGIAAALPSGLGGEVYPGPARAEGSPQPPAGIGGIPHQGNRVRKRIRASPAASTVERDLRGFLRCLCQVPSFYLRYENYSLGTFFGGGVLETERNPQASALGERSLFKSMKSPLPDAARPGAVAPAVRRGAQAARKKRPRGQAGSGCARRAALGQVRAGRGCLGTGFGQRRYLLARESSPAGKNPRSRLNFWAHVGPRRQAVRQPLARQGVCPGTRLAGAGLAPPKQRHGKSSPPP